MAGSINVHGSIFVQTGNPISKNFIDRTKRLTEKMLFGGTRSGFIIGYYKVNLNAIYRKGGVFDD